MKVRKTQTRFMNGNIDVDGIVADILTDNHGQKAFLTSDFDTDNAIYSDGFIKAIESGLIPCLELLPTDSHRFYNENEEYHHVIINDVCYNVHFKENV